MEYLIKKLKISNSILALIVGIFFCFLVAAGVLFFIGTDFQKKIEMKALMLKDGESVSTVIVGARKLCLQSAYVTRKDFELVARENVNFKTIDFDDKFRLHVFYFDGSTQQVLMGENMIRIDRHSLQACKSTDIIQLRKSDKFVLISL